MRNMRLFKIKKTVTADGSDRVSIFDTRRKMRRSIAWDYELSGLSEQAEVFLAKKEIEIVGYSWIGDVLYFMSDNFETSIKPDPYKPVVKLYDLKGKGDDCLVSYIEYENDVFLGKLRRQRERYEEKLNEVTK